MINILVAEEIHPATLPELQDMAFVEHAVNLTLRLASQPQDANVTIVIAGDDQLQELNKQFLDIDAPTDVLSFPADEIDPETGEPYLGDVVISYARAAAQAAAGGHSVLDELQLLVVHGVLHLLGHDHASVDEKAHMWAVQKQALVELGCAINGSME